MVTPLVELAIELAAEWHDGTYRKGRWRDGLVVPPAGTLSRVPVLAHVTAVAFSVHAAGWGEKAVAAAFLHDALEDPNRHRQSLRRGALAALVGEAVVRIVEAVTEPQPVQGLPLPWLVRKEGYLDRLENGPLEAAAVALADKHHNAHAMASSLEAGVDPFQAAPGRRALSAGPADQLWFFEAALDATRRHDDPRLVPMREAVEGQITRFRRAAGLAVPGGTGRPT